MTSNGIHGLYFIIYSYFKQSPTPIFLSQTKKSTVYNYKNIGVGARYIFITFLKSVGSGDYIVFCSPLERRNVIEHE